VSRFARKNPPRHPPKAVKPKRERIVGPFYQCSEPWADKAAGVAGRYFVLALRLYRCWRVRKLGTDTIAITTSELAGPGYTRDGKQRVVLVLEAAGLIEVVERAPGRAPRVRVIDPQLQSRTYRVSQYPTYRAVRRTYRAVRRTYRVSLYLSLILILLIPLLCDPSS
jgi:hypothetical protein